MVTLRETVMIHDLKRQGLGVSAIARRTGLDRKTVRKHLERGMEAGRYGPRQPRPRLLTFTNTASPSSSNSPNRFATWARSRPRRTPSGRGP